MKVYFSYGKESGSWGTKITRLARIAEGAGCAVESIDYSDLMDPDLRVERLQEVLAEEEESFLLVGSSMGGYVSLMTSAAVSAKAIFLMAPALYMPGYEGQHYCSRRRTGKELLPHHITRRSPRSDSRIRCKSIRFSVSAW
jgi:predicted esterase YcpF (UPF0227 family)